MNRRKEPRFQVYAPAKVALLEDPERETDGQVLDVSGAGLRLVADAEFREDQIITIETDQHLILADVRSCLVRGTRFGIGAERIHSAAKLSLPLTASKAERNQALVEDFHRRLREELQNAPDRVAVRSDTAVERFQASHAAAGSPRAPEAPKQVVDVAAPEPRITPEPQPESGTIVAEPPPAGAFLPGITPAGPPGIRLGSQEHLPFVATPVTLSRHAGTIQPDFEPLPAIPAAGAAEDAGHAEVHAEPEVPAAPLISLPPGAMDPIREAAMRAAEQTPEAPEAQAGSRTIAVLIAAALTLAALLALLYGPFTKRAALVQTSTAAKSGAAPVSAPASAPVSAPVSATSSKPTPPPALPQPAPRRAPAVGKSRVSIAASDRSWVTACADGNPVFSKLFTAGSKQELVFSSRAVVRMGSAGPVELQLNDKPVGPLGRPGQVRVIEFTPESSRFLNPGEPGDCTR